VSELDAVTFGETMGMFIADSAGDLTSVENFTRKLAGAESNVAIGLARLGFKVGWVSRLGGDYMGRYIRHVLTAEGVDIGRVVDDPARSTGFLVKSHAEGGDPTVEYFRRGSAASRLSVADFDAGYFLAARHLHATGIAAALSDDAMDLARLAMQKMRHAGRTVSFDPNLRPSLWPSRAVMVERINELACAADWVLPGLSEGRILTGLTTPEGISAFYLDRGCKVVAIKLGPEGAYVRTPKEAMFVPGVAVERVVDTVGAGDAFAVGFVSAMFEGLGVVAAAARGNRLGALAIQVAGDMDGLPTRTQLAAQEAA
jgi:sugar/nucleoside kinase (ribokinase family)